MGALHEGHFSLVAQSVADNDRTCVSIFINPRQFGPNEDLESYPRDKDADLQALEDRNADLLFAPSIDEMYAEGFVTKVSVPGIGDQLEGEFRPGFFTGIATVVSKLLIQALPDRAYFGEKDYQQLCVIRRMKLDLDLPVEIIACPVIRDRDGLALSSRNSYLTPDQRALAPTLYHVLTKTAECFYSFADANQAILAGSEDLLDTGFTKVDYIAICNPITLELVEKSSGPVRVLGAAWLGSNRLIDNIEK